MTETDTGAPREGKNTELRVGCCDGRVPRSLGESAYCRLKREILTSKLSPGFQATEPEFAERLGMSRTPVREALIRLDAEGLVELVPRRGARVLPVQLDDIAEIFEILSTLCPMIAEELARRGLGAEELEGLRMATEELKAANLNDDASEWREAEDAFHMRMAELHGSKRLMATLGQLSMHIRRVGCLVTYFRTDRAASTAEIESLFQAISDGDAPRSRETCERHCQRVSTEILRLLRSFDGAGVLDAGEDEPQAAV